MEFYKSYNMKAKEIKHITRNTDGGFATIIAPVWG
jgi:hypothetical protein